EGSSFSGAVATFTDANPFFTTADFTATIAWGDGNTSSGAVALASGTFTVSGTHTYAEEGTYAVAITVTDDDGSTANPTATATIGDPAVTATGVAVSATEGVSTGTVAVATFSDPAGAETVGDYSATIDWGDGTATSAGILSVSGGAFTVKGAHTYADQGSHTTTVTVSHGSASNAGASSTATVHDAALTASNGTGFTATEGAGTGTVTVATFSDANPGATAADFAGTTITWGDGATTAATVTLSGGTFSVTGSHIYAEEKAYVATAHIVDDGGSTASTTHAAIAGYAALSATNGAGLTATEGTSTGPVTVATFTDANPGATAA